MNSKRNALSHIAAAGSAAEAAIRDGKAKYCGSLTFS
jgi:hypothetical protein